MRSEANAACPVLGLMEVAAVGIEPNHIDKGVNVIVQERIAE